MRISKKTVVTAVAVLGLAGATGAALASHGKAGLWRVDMSIAGQDTSKMPPNVLDRMKSMGMMPNSSGGFTVQHCMTADLVCKGQMNGTGHVSVNYDTPTHYTGEMTISGKTADGTPIAQDQKVEGRWVSASCGSVAH